MEWMLGPPGAAGLEEEPEMLPSGQTEPRAARPRTQPRFIQVEDAGPGRTALPGWTLPSHQAWAVFPERRLMPAKTRAFIDMLEHTLTPAHHSPEKNTQTFEGFSGPAG